MRFEVTESYYDTYEELTSVPNIFESGWVPHWLPKTAHNIKESHDIDTNEAWMVFKFSSSDKFYTGCQVINKKDIVIPTEKQTIRFPRFVIDAIEYINHHTLVFYNCEKNSNRYLAIDGKTC